MPNQTSLQRAKLVAARRMQARKSASLKNSAFQTIPGTETTCTVCDKPIHLEFDEEDNYVTAWYDNNHRGDCYSPGVKPDGYNHNFEGHVPASGISLSDDYAKTAYIKKAKDDDKSDDDSDNEDNDLDSDDSDDDNENPFVEEDDKKEGSTLTDTTKSAREAALAKVKARRLAETKTAKPAPTRRVKRADSINPNPTNDDGALDDVESVDVTDEVSVDNVTDNTPEQHSVDNASENNDSFYDEAKPGKEEGHSTMNFLPGEKQSSVRKASFALVAELTDLYISVANMPVEKKYSKIAELQVLPLTIVQDRINLLKDVKAGNKTARVASVSTRRPVPPRIANPNPSLSLGRRTANSRLATDELDAILTLK